MMKRKKKWGCALTAVLVVAVVGIFGLHWAWKYYGLPEWPDRKEYKTIEERAEKALAFARRHNMNEHYALFVDYGIPSGTPRLFVWDFQQKKIIASTYVMHGPGGGSTAERPRFSNRPGSECSSLGRFLVTKDRGSRLKHSFRLKGMDFDNQSAYERGLMIHSSRWVDKWCWKEHIPLHRSSCQGCDRSRLGYMAMLGANSVIGVSRSDKVKDYVQERGGSFFRQFILVSNGTIPASFYLHGKVERRAIGRINNQLYYIATRHKETLWDFTDALREYGFIDAIYITGGADYVFYRDNNGIRHDIGDTADYPHTKWKGIIPWLVFRK